jgi:hypothetical protein
LQFKRLLVNKKKVLLNKKIMESKHLALAMVLLPPDVDSNIV